MRPRTKSRRPSVEALEPRTMLSTYYVATSGNDSNNGSQGSPFRTMQHAMISLQPGDTLNVEQGSFPGWISGWDSVPASGGDAYGTIDGTAGSPITIRADPNAPAGSVIINSRNSKTPSGIDLEPNCNYITIKGFTITNGDGSISHYGIKVAQSNYVNILNNTVYSVGLTGIFTAFASDGIIRNNVCYSNGEHGIYISNSPQNDQILNNISHDNANGGIQVNADVTQGGSGIAQNFVIADNIIYNNGSTGGGALNFDGLQNSLVENNLLYNNHASGLVLYKYNAAAGSINNIIVNNTVVQAAGARPALNNNTSSSGNYFYNDIFLGNMMVDSTSTPAAFSNNVLLNGYVNEGSYQFPPSIMSTATALFADASGSFTQPGDYQLFATSPAVDAGTSTDAPSTDIVGNPRPSGSGYDIGAYEYQQATAGFTLAPGSSSVTAGNSLNITVTATLGGATNTNYRGTVHFTSSDSQAGLPSDYTFTSSDQGVHTFSVTLKTAGSQSVTVTDAGNSSDTAATPITVNPAAASGLVVSGFPSSTAAGVSQNFTVTAEDAYGNVATGFTDTVQFSSSDSQANLPANYTFVAGDAGTHTFSATLNTPGTASLTATETSDPSCTGTESGITVTAVDGFTLAPASGSVTAGNSLNITVTATLGGVTYTGYRGTVHFTSSDSQAGLPSDYTFTSSDQGVHTFRVTLKTAGSQSVTVTDTGNSSNTGSTTITVNPAAASSLVVSGFPSSTTAGVSHNFTVTAQDAYGNVATGYTGTVQFTSSDTQASLPAAYTFVAGDGGVHTFSATLKTAGTKSLTATDMNSSSITGTDSGIAVTPAAASTLIVSGFPSSTTAGASHNFTVTVQDAYGNVATGYRGTVHFTSSDPQASLPAAYTFTAGDAGTHTFSATLKTAATASLTATDTNSSSITGTESGITVTPAAASTLGVAGFPHSITAGTAANVTVTALDLYGNTATGYTGTVHFTSSDGQAVLPANYTFTSSDHGTHTFSATLKTAGTQSLTATDTTHSSLTGTESGITVSPAAASKLSVSRFPKLVTAGSRHSFMVAAVDPYGNVATGYRGTVHFTSSDPKAKLPGDYTFTAADGGVHTFSARLMTVGTQSITSTDVHNGSIAGSETGIVVTASGTYTSLPSTQTVASPAGSSIGAPTLSAAAIVSSTISPAGSTIQSSSAPTSVNSARTGATLGNPSLLTGTLLASSQRAILKNLQEEIAANRALALAVLSANVDPVTLDTALGMIQKKGLV